MTTPRKAPPSLRRTFGISGIIAAVSLIGLIAALLSDGLFDITSWIALAVPIAAIGWATLRRRA